MLPIADSAARAIARAEWQPLLFDRLHRAELSALRAPWPSRKVRARVHRNHAFEPVASATPPFAAWNGLTVDWVIGPYDDTFTFDWTEGAFDAEILWIDAARLDGLAGDDVWAAWLIDRVGALRAQTSAPILILAWPLSPAVRARVGAAGIHAMYLADLETIAHRLNEHWTDARTADLSGTRLSNRSCLEVARELACSWLPATVGVPIKAIALDLDGTLYDGVLGEDGEQSVVLTPGHEGLQAYLVELHQRGIFLALVSRNELADIERMFDRRRDFPLRLGHFSSIEASWGDKASALERVAAQLRIGADAMIFVDDNPGELAAAASRSPAVTVHARPDGAQTVEALRHVAGVFRWGTSAEDLLRTADLNAAAVRTSLMRDEPSPESYLRSLGIQLEFYVGAMDLVPRMAELSRKTNQFNLSLRRLNEAEIAQRIAERSANVVAVRLRDRLSDSGIIAVVVGTPMHPDMRVELLAVSCRALGRRLEDTMLSRALLLLAGDEQPAKLSFEIAKGPRNSPALDWITRFAGLAAPSDGGRIEVEYARVRAMVTSRAVEIVVHERAVAS